METLWFMIVAFMLVAYVVLDGFDIGAGIVHYVIGRSDAEREAAGIPDPLAEFTDQQEYDFIRARYKWDSKKKVWSTDAPTRELMRLLVIFFSTLY